MPPLLNGFNPAAAQGPSLNISAPFNDVQTVALLAVWCPGDGAKCKVHKAQDILLEAFREKHRFEQGIQKIKRGDDE